MLQPATGGYDSVEVTPSARVVWPTLTTELLAEVLDRMAPAERASAARAARRFAELAAEAGKALAAGPLPL